MAESIQGAGPSPFESLYPEIHGEIIKFLDDASLVSFALTGKTFHKRYFLPSHVIPGGRFFDECFRNGHSELFKWALDVHCPFDLSSIDYVLTFL
jgi:hypothetical protein